MLLLRLLLTVLTILTVTSCQSDDSSEVISQTYVHKYGFNLTEKEWNERDQDGQIITVLEDKTVITQSYENGVLHGLSTKTYPNSNIIFTEKLYDQGILLKEIINDEKGIPVKEEAYEFDDRKVITRWYANGAPMSIEEYDSNLLVEGSYFDLSNELESSIEEGTGMRVKRDRQGVLQIHDTLENGIVTVRKTYHPNGQLQSESHFVNNQLHGPQTKYTVTGKPLLEQYFHNGALDGLKKQYRNGKKVLEIPYVMGQKNGVEKHYDLDGTLTAEIPYENNIKHGRSRYQSEDFSDLIWHFRGKPVTRNEFNDLVTREKMLAELSLDND
ncbi:MAG: hypothetical protein COT84_00260 [Chlamydiae bacterium CG10_big_fil_rev_8_21_14_0_10_35_9]|nr:MAG: hypothetical protein COT84_00260 [Chlamydiae bacterium CG10_big_fil_rev_8_21_14_0_10_35_9]